MSVGFSGSPNNNFQCLWDVCGTQYSEMKSSFKNQKDKKQNFGMYM